MTRYVWGERIPYRGSRFIYFLKKIEEDERYNIECLTSSLGEGSFVAYLDGQKRLREHNLSSFTIKQTPDEELDNFLKSVIKNSQVFYFFPSIGFRIVTSAGNMGRVEAYIGVYGSGADMQVVGEGKTEEKAKENRQMLENILLNPAAKL